jgi:hypothetical protein
MMYTNMTKKNHKTTTVLFTIAALAATLVAASTMAATTLGSDHSAFAHKKASKALKNKGILTPTVTKQVLLCITAGGNSPITGSCAGTATNTVAESGGVADTSAPMKLPFGVSG